MGLSLPGAHWGRPWPLLKEPAGGRGRASPGQPSTLRSTGRLLRVQSCVLPSKKETSQIGLWELTELTELTDSELTELTASAPPLQEGRSLIRAAVVQLNPRQRRPSERAYRA